MFFIVIACWDDPVTAIINMLLWSARSSADRWLECRGGIGNIRYVQCGKRKHRRGKHDATSSGWSSSTSTMASSCHFV